MFEGIVNFMNMFFMYYIFTYAIIFFFSTIYSMIDLNESKLRKRYKNTIEIENESNYIPISVLIPAYNEETTVVDCIKSILGLDYPEFEVVVVSDGSTDMTPENIIEAFEMRQVVRPIRKLVNCKNEISTHEGTFNNGEKKIKITLVNKENGGKADALNMGINVARYPLVAALDADSVLQKDSLLNIVTPFMENETTVAVGGNIKVSNQVVIQNGEVKKVLVPKKYLVIMQMIEYYRVFLTTRVWFNKFNGNLIISGAFGVFKKKAAINVGGYDTTSVGEDMELVVKLHSFYRKHGLSYSIQYVPDAICWSQVPTKLKDLKSQRRRWHMGLIQSIWEHRYIFMKPTYGVVGVFSFLYFLIYELLSCIIEVVGLIFIIIAISFGYINMKFFFTFLLIYVIYSFIVSLAAIVLETYMFKGMITLKTALKFIIFSMIEPIGYRQFCSWFRLLGIVQYSKRHTSWGKITRQVHNK